MREIGEKMEIERKIEVPERKTTKIAWFVDVLERSPARIVMLGFDNWGQIKGFRAVKMEYSILEVIYLF